MSWLVTLLAVVTVQTVIVREYKTKYVIVTQSVNYMATVVLTLTSSASMSYSS